MIALLLLLPAATAAPSPIAAQYRPVTGFIRPSKQSVDLEYSQKAKALQQEMLALQQSDGGVLTESHRAHLQAKAAELLASYREEMQKIDPMSVNANGTPRR